MSLDTQPTVTRVDEAAASRPSGEPARDSHEPHVDLADLLVLGAVTLVGLTAWVSLALAQLGHFSLVAVIAGTVATIGLAVVVFRRHLRAAPSASVGGIALASVTLLAGLFMFLPGAPYVYGDKDPGIYVLHGAAIERHGSIEVPDVVRAADPDTVIFAPGARFPGVWIEDSADEVTPQFYHLYPSLLAVANGVGGVPASFHVNPVLAALAAAALALAVKRVAGWAAGALAAAFLVTNMLEVWQAKYPTTEILTQLLVVGSLLGVAIAARTRWRPAAGLAGVLAGLTFLARPDGLIIVLLGLAAAAVVFVVDPRDTRVRWFVGGLALTLPHALLNAYDLREGYSLANDLPSLGLTTTAIAGLAVGTAAAVGLKRAVPAVGELLRVDQPLWPRLAPAAAVGLTVGFLAVIALFRLRATGGESFFDYNGREVRSYDELNLVRLSFYWPLRAFVISALGLLALGFWRRRPSTWIVALVLLPPLPLYLWAAKNSPRLMWWGRRFVPIALPALVILAAIGAAWLLVRGPWWVQVPAAILVGSVLFETLSMSLPLRDHREFGGSYDFGVELAEVTDDGVLLWEKPTPNDIFALNRNMPSVMWFVHDLPNAYLDPADSGSAVDAASELLPGAPIYVIVEDGEPPADLVGSLEPVATLDATFPYWEELLDERPDEAVSVARSIEIFRLDPTRSTS